MMSALKKELTLLQYGFLGWFQTDPVPDDCVSFSAYKNSGWKMILIAVFFMIGFESLGIQVFLQSRHSWFASVHLGLVIYGFIWLLGDYQAIKKHLLTIESDSIHVRIGLRWDFSIPFENIQAIELGTPKDREPPAQIKMNEFVKKRKIPGYEIVTVAGKPNLFFTLKSPMTIEGLFGRKKTMRLLGLSIDEPGKFVESVLKSSCF